MHCPLVEVLTARGETEIDEYLLLHLASSFPSTNESLKTQAHKTEREVEEDMAKHISCAWMSRKALPYLSLFSRE